MGNTYTRIIYQVVFSTKHRQPTLWKPRRADLFAYMGQTLKNKKCFVYRVGGVDDHVHLVFALHPTVALSDLVKDIKLAASDWMKNNPTFFPAFDYWQGGYGAFTYTKEALPNLIRYVDNQEAHHDTESSRDELRRLLTEHGIEIDDRYFC